MNLEATAITGAPQTAYGSGTKAQEPPYLRSGAGVRIAIVDSGVDSTHPWLASALVSHFSVQRRGECFEVIKGEPIDRSGHGTACAGIVHRMAPAAEIASVCTLGPDGRGSRDALLAALRFAVREKFDVVSCSLGIDLPRGAPLRPVDQRSIVELYELADSAYVAGVVVCASGPNVAHYRTYPARLKALIGVGRAAFTDPEMLASELTADYEVVAPGVDVLAPALDGGERRYTGTSFACPHVAAHLARLRAANPLTAVHDLKASLHALARARQGRRASGAPGEDFAVQGVPPKTDFDPSREESSRATT